MKYTGSIYAALLLFLFPVGHPQVVAYLPLEGMEARAINCPEFVIATPPHSTTRTVLSAVRDLGSSFGPVTGSTRLHNQGTNQPRRFKAHLRAQTSNPPPAESIKACNSRNREERLIDAGYATKKQRKANTRTGCITVDVNAIEIAAKTTTTGSNTGHAACAKPQKRTSAFKTKLQLLTKKRKRSHAKSESTVTLKTLRKAPTGSEKTHRENVSTTVSNAPDGNLRSSTSICCSRTRPPMPRDPLLADACYM